MEHTDQAHDRVPSDTLSRLSRRIAALPGPGSRLRRFDSRFPIRPRDGSPWKIRCRKRTTFAKTISPSGTARRPAFEQWSLLRLFQPDRLGRRSLSWRHQS